MINQELVKKVNEQIFNSYRNMYNKLANAGPDVIHPTIKNLFMAYLSSVLGNDKDKIMQFNNANCGPRITSEIITYILQDLINKKNENINNGIEPFITKVINAVICFSVEQFPMVFQNFKNEMEFSVNASQARDHLVNGINEFKNEFIPRWKAAKREIDNLNSNLTGNSNPFAGVVMTGQQSNQQNNPFATSYTQGTPQSGSNSIPYYLTEQMPGNGYTATTNQAPQSPQPTQMNFNTSTTQVPVQNSPQKEMVFNPNANYRYAILRNPYTTTFTVTDKGELQLSKLSFDISRVGLDESISNYNWLLDRNPFISGEKPIISNAVKQIDGKDIIVEREVYNQFEHNTVDQTVFTRLSNFGGTSSHVITMINHSAKHWNGIPHAWNYVLTVKKCLPVSLGNMKFIEFILNEYNNNKSLLELATLLTASHKQIMDNEIDDTNKINNIMCSTVLDLLDDILTEYVTRQLYRNMSCIDVKIDNFATDYMEAAEVAKTDSDVLEMVKVLENKNKTMSETLRLKMDEDFLIVEEDFLLVNVDILYQELEIDFYHDLPSIVTNESKSFKLLLNYVTQMLKDKKIKTAIITTIDAVSLYVTEAYWVPGQYTVSKK